MQNNASNPGQLESEGQAGLSHQDIFEFTETDYYLKKWGKINNMPGGFSGFK
jgi:hypothetical protein